MITNQKKQLCLIRRQKQVNKTAGEPVAPILAAVYALTRICRFIYVYKILKKKKKDSG